MAPRLDVDSQASRRPDLYRCLLGSCTPSRVLPAIPWWRSYSHRSRCTDPRFHAVPGDAADATFLASVSIFVWIARFVQTIDSAPSAAAGVNVLNTLANGYRWLASEGAPCAGARVTTGEKAPHTSPPQWLSCRSQRWPAHDPCADYQSGARDMVNVRETQIAYLCMYIYIEISHMLNKISNKIIKMSKWKQS